MNKIYAQFQREFWEHRGILITAPWVMVVIFALFTAMTFYGLQRDEVLLFDAAQKAAEQAQLNEKEPSWTINFNNESDTINIKGDIDPLMIFTEKNKLISVQSGIYMVASVITIFLSFIYATGSLFTDRRDRSILFFKSLPVSETQVVLTRLAIAVVVMPLLATLCALAGSLIFFVAASFYGVLYADLSWLNPWQQINPFSIYFKSVIAGLLAGLWALPLFSWLLLCSAWAKRTPLLNAAIPIIALVLFDRMVLEKRIVTDTFKHFFAGFKNGDFFGNMPIAVDAKLNLSEFFLRANLWIGLAIAIVFIGMAIFLRNRRFEV